MFLTANGGTYFDSLILLKYLLFGMSFWHLSVIDWSGQNKTRHGNGGHDLGP